MCKLLLRTAYDRGNAGGQRVKDSKRRGGSVQVGWPDERLLEAKKKKKKKFNPSRIAKEHS